jgi:aspartate/methionine/tyrosine aminotransferase
VGPDLQPAPAIVAAIVAAIHENASIPELSGLPELREGMADFMPKIMV